MDTKKMRACAPLLPPPGDAVVVECLDEIERLRIALEDIASGEIGINLCIKVAKRALTPNEKLRGAP